MLNTISTSLALTRWTPPASQQDLLPASYRIVSQPTELFTDEEGEFAHRRSNESEDLGYDQRAHVHQQSKRGLIIDSYC
jgi:hypothetical protein